MSRPRCTGVVLAGGGSTRFGGAPKGLLEIAGRRVLDRVLDALTPVVDVVLLSANAPDAASWAPGVPVHADPVGLGPRAALVGLLAALRHARGPALVVAWDMPFLSSPLLAHLRALGEADDTAVVPTGTRGLEPLCAYYPASCADTAEQRIASGDLRLEAFARALPRRLILGPERMTRFGDPSLLFANLNTPEDLAAAERSLARLHAVPIVSPSPSTSGSE